MTCNTDDLRIKSIKEVIPPDRVRDECPVSDAAAKTTFETRNAIHEILAGRDDRLLVVVGPCSIHDVKAAREYGERLTQIRDELVSDLVIVMRVYFEKPRTTHGWKGLINDPNLDGTFQINEGLRLARHLLMDLNESGMPAATEFLDLISPQYVAELVSWGAIGARTTESQVHRELASGLSCPVGFKNSTDGDLKVAIDAIGSASRPHHFLSLTKAGRSAIFATRGNDDCHLILRGGRTPNYDADSVEAVAMQLQRAGLPPNIMIDFSHANSQKQYERQLVVGHDVSGQIAADDRRIIGVMIESHLIAGRQDIAIGQEPVYGQSVTDACIGWDETVPLLHELAKSVRHRRSLAH